MFFKVKYTNPQMDNRQVEKIAYVLSSEVEVTLEIMLPANTQILYGSTVHFLTCLVAALPGALNGGNKNKKRNVLVALIFKVYFPFLQPTLHSNIRVSRVPVHHLLVNTGIAGR